jgi:hypothetical protein
LAGTVTMSGIANTVPSLSAFIDALSTMGDPKNPDLDAVWLNSAQRAKFGSTDVITFSISATLAPGARSDRLETFLKEPLCKK